MDDDYLARLGESLKAALSFSEIRELHGAPGNPWRVPVLDARTPRPQGPVHSEVEMLCLMWAFVIMLKPKLVIETGSDSGVMTRALGGACQANGFGRVLSAEVNADLVDAARRLCWGLPVDIHHGPALDLPIEQADLLFVDSSYESRQAELRRVRPGAVAVVHDTTRETGLGQHVAETYPRHIRVVTPRGFMVVQK